MNPSFWDESIGEEASAIVIDSCKSLLRGVKPEIDNSDAIRRLIRCSDVLIAVAVCWRQGMSLPCLCGAYRNLFFFYAYLGLVMQTA